MMPEDERKRLAGLQHNLERRAIINHGIRSFFRKRGFLEIETPVRVPVVAPEPYIIPITSEDWFLSTSPELHMKRLLAAGYPRLFQLSRCFRRGERGRWHNPEFTMLEWYRAEAGYRDMIEDTGELLLTLASKLGCGGVINYGKHRIDISLPWPELTISQAYRDAAGWDPLENWDPARFDIDFIEKVMPSLPDNRPVVLTGYPAPAAALARLDEQDKRIAERAEIFIGGLELANAYSELTDATEQEKRFEDAIREIKQEGREALMPRLFLDAVPYLPPCGGIALGIDRLVMLFCNAAHIDEVMPFTVDTA